MRAVLVERPGCATLSSLPVPKPGPGEVLVEVAAAGICGSDLELLQGSRPEGAETALRLARRGGP